MTPEEEEKLIKRVEFSEKRLDDFMELLEMKDNARDSAMALEEIEASRFWSLFQIVMELANRAGVSQEDFVAHFDLRFQLLHDKALARIQKIDSGTAARLDLRTLAEVPTHEVCPSLFDPPQV